MTFLCTIRETMGGEARPSTHHCVITRGNQLLHLCQQASTVLPLVLYAASLHHNSNHLREGKLKSCLIPMLSICTSNTQGFHRRPSETSPAFPVLALPFIVLHPLYVNSFPLVLIQLVHTSLEVSPDTLTYSPNKTIPIHPLHMFKPPQSARQSTHTNITPIPYSLIISPTHLNKSYIK